MKLLKSTFAVMLAVTAFSQSTPPPVHINFVSHNEPSPAYQTNPGYAASRTKVLELAAIIDAAGAAWNLETCADFVKGAMDTEGAANNLFRTLAGAQYVDNIEIDPRYKSNSYGNVADLYHILDSLGANVTHTLGGFVWWTSNAGAQPIDWFPYESELVSTSTDYPPVHWQCEIMWGAGSYLPHTHDIDNWGIWKPDNVNTFTTHNPARNVWYIGNGCSPLGTDYTSQPQNPGSFDPTDDVTDVTIPLKAFIDSIQHHLLPWDQYYNYSITINQADFGTTLFNKISDICDSVNAWGTDKIVWSKLTDRLADFQQWSDSFNIQYSQWDCGQVWPIVGLNETTQEEITLFPNPTNGLFQIELSDLTNDVLEIVNVYGQTVKTIFPESLSISVDLTDEPAGIYLLHRKGSTQNSGYRFVKE